MFDRRLFIPWGGESELRKDISGWREISLQGNSLAARCAFSGPERDSGSLAFASVAVVQVVAAP